MHEESIISDHPVLLFDGICNLCNGSVIAIVNRDPQAKIRFASLQSELGQKLVTQHQLDQKDIDSVIMIYEGQAFVKSDAVFRVLQLLGGFYRLFLVFKILPRGLRDLIYDWIAANRYVWFGKRDVCMIPTPDLDDRFLS